jgi:CRP/FNR family transcriptional regulator, cyclic AMP receptor protein
MPAASLDLKRDLLKRHFLFREFTPAELDELLAYARVERFRAHATVLLKGAPGTGMMAVLKGEIRISAPGADGREVVFNTLGPGDIFGEVALLDGGERSADATAVADTEVLVIERRDFLPFLERHPPVATKLLVALCAKLRRTTEQVEDLALLDLPARLAKKLLSLAGAQGRATSQGLRIDTKLSQGDLAKQLATSRETVNKQLARWQREGVLRLDDGAITVLDSEALQRVLDQD